jgi:hypothetical protein
LSVGGRRGRAHRPAVGDAKAIGLGAALTIRENTRSDGLGASPKDGVEDDRGDGDPDDRDERTASSR